MNDIGYLTDRELEVVRRALFMYGKRSVALSDAAGSRTLNEMETARDLDIRFMGARRVEVVG